MAINVKTGHLAFSLITKLKCAIIQWKNNDTKDYSEQLEFLNSQPYYASKKLLTSRQIFRYAVPARSVTKSTAAVLYTVSKCWLKYSTKYDSTGDAPCSSLGCHDNEMLVGVSRLTVGRLGAAGNVDGSGIRWKTTDALEGRLTSSWEVHEVSPVWLATRHVYEPLSFTASSTHRHTDTEL